MCPVRLIFRNEIINEHRYYRCTFRKFIGHIKINIHEYENTVIINNNYLFNSGFITLPDMSEIRLVLISKFQIHFNRY